MADTPPKPIKKIPIHVHVSNFEKFTHKFIFIGSSQTLLRSNKMLFIKLERVTDDLLSHYCFACQITSYATKLLLQIHIETIGNFGSIFKSSILLLVYFCIEPKLIENFLLRFVGY